MSGAQGSAGWSGDLDDELGLSAGLDLAAFLGLESEQDDDEGESSVEVDDVIAGLGLDGGAGLIAAGLSAAMDLVDVGADLDED